MICTQDAVSLLSSTQNRKTQFFSYTPIWSGIFWFQKIWSSDTTSQHSFGKHFSGILFFFYSLILIPI